MLYRKIYCFLLLTLSLCQTFAQTDCVDYDISSYPKTINHIQYDWNGAAWNFTNLKQHKVSGLSFGNFFFKGLLEYLPGDYNAANTSVKYPLIIFFHGGASSGQGTAADLCRLFKDRGLDLATHLSIPGRVERETGLFTQTYLAQTFKYIVVSPQFTVYRRQYNPDKTPVPGNAYPSANEVEQVINYMVDGRYANKIDTRRIYLVGYSNGANMIIEYAGSSVARAKRVAAIMPVSLCSQLDHPSNAGITAANIAAAGLKTWFVYCKDDNCGSGDPLDVPQAWVSAIRAAGGAGPRLTMLTRAGAVGAGVEGLYNCSDTLAHDAWSRAFDPNFKASYTGNGASSNPNDGINLNMYQWFTQQLSAVLPVTLTSFSARVRNKEVHLGWITADEKDNLLFTIERAGADQKFVPIGNIPGSVNTIGEKTYSFIDDSPLSGLSFYRLSQTDVDGKKEQLGVRKILNRSEKSYEVIVSPNPFYSFVSAFISVESGQNVTATLRNAAGTVVHVENIVCLPGSSELRMNVQAIAKGIYFLKIEGRNFTLTRKVVKQ